MNYLYLIKEYPLTFGEEVPDLYVKIGISEDPEQRVKQLQTSNPRPLMLEAVRPISSTVLPQQYESKVHEIFKQHRVSGEWFKSHDDIWDWSRKNMLQDPKTDLKLSNEDYFLKLGCKQGKDEVLQKIKEPFERLLDARKIDLAWVQKLREKYGAEILEGSSFWVEPKSELQIEETQQ